MVGDVVAAWQTGIPDTRVVALCARVAEQCGGRVTGGRLFVDVARIELHRVARTGDDKVRYVRCCERNEGCRSTHASTANRKVLGFGLREDPW